MAEVEQKKKRTFRKFTYRGVDLDQLLDMSYEQLMQLYSARQRRRLNRGLRRKQHSLLKRLRKAKKEAPPMEKPEVVKTHLRDMIILPEMVGSMVGVYNGKTFNQVEIKVRAAVPANRTGPGVGWGRLTRAGSPDTQLRSWSPAARDDWPLPGRVLHHLQTREARPARHWSHPLLPLHPSQVVAQLIKAHLAPVLRGACSSRCPGLWEGPGPGSGLWCEEVQAGLLGLCGSVAWMASVSKTDSCAVPIPGPLPLLLSAGTAVELGAQAHV
ncbi:PREDICTED: 40S ribosomal protein S15 isoform X2 [Cercocebus atys]|uniref:40S ribosomal protein S15 isoform X2 n=1 Tax=Cercocebus atys TaxID=9531 RepID=UPI0005F4A3C3|nr:PREDICTED: 40S ribosomal protein S15 isoform X2 [Cercocebus atys]